MKVALLISILFSVLFSLLTLGEARRKGVITKKDIPVSFVLSFALFLLLIYPVVAISPYVGTVILSGIALFTLVVLSIEKFVGGRE